MRWIPVLLLAAACSGSDGQVPGGAVVGAWRAIPPATQTPPPPVDSLTVYTFGDDGTWTRAEGGDHRSGTYVIEDGELALAGSVTHSSYYFADDARLLLDVATPDDDGADAVATWTGHVVDSNGRVDDAATFDADMTFHLSERRGDATATYDGTWLQLDDTLEATYDVGNLTDLLDVTLYRGLIGTAFEPI
jgi:hypothetical protein